MYCSHSHRTNVALQRGCEDSLYIDCSSETPSITEYKSLVLKSGNGITAMAYLESRFTESGDGLLFVACWDQSIFAITQDSVRDLEVNDRFSGRLRAMAFSPDRQFLACATENGWISVVTTSFVRKVGMV